MSNQKFKTATILTIMVMAIYFVLLLVMQLNGTLPLEKDIYVMSPDNAIELPFSVSYWYGLLLFPAVLMVLGVYTALDNYVGQEPRENNFSQGIKYQARLMSVFAPALALGFGMAVGALCILSGPFLPEAGGPVSALVNTILVTVCSYSVLGTVVMAVSLITYDLDYYDAKDGHKQKMHSITDTYLQMSAQLFKNSGFALAFPLLVGCTLGYMIRLVAHTATTATRATITMVVPGKAAEV